MGKVLPRVRMFAGPNGSGKSTIKSVIHPDLLGIYINPDEIEAKVRTEGFLDLNDYAMVSNDREIVHFFVNSSLLKSSGFHEIEQCLRFSENKVYFSDMKSYPYFAAVASDFIRNKLVDSKKSFSFETVMSHPDKVELLIRAQQQGYRTYLYYVATEDPEINISRVRNRVKMGGHSVPEDKIVSRYHNSLNLLLDAVKHTHRAYIFDNSGMTHLWIAEITDGKILETKTDQMPLWFKKSLWDKFNGTSP